MELLDSEEFVNQPLPESFGENLQKLLQAQVEADPDERISELEQMVRLAFQTLVRREPVDHELAHNLPLLENQTVSFSQFLQGLAQSDETAYNRLSRTFLDSLHRSRIQVVKQLPRAQVIVDLGGASGSNKEGALLEMGYPYHFDQLSIIDMPLELRHESYGDMGYYPDIIPSAQGPIQYIYCYMTDLARFESGTVDLVFSGETIEHITRAEGTVFCQEAYRILKPGGFFCLDTPNRAVTQITHPTDLIHPEHKHEYTHAELAGLLQDTGFVIREAKGLCWASEKAGAGLFTPDRQSLECTIELLKHEGIYDDIENCFCLYYNCQKPA